MNRKATYEITITEKLRQLPVPDMRDAIWNRIEQQLDLDMPDDDGPDNPDSPDKTRWINTARKVGPFALVVAIITLFFISKNNNSNHTNDKQPVNSETVSPQNNDPGSPPRTINKTSNGKPELGINNANAPVKGSDSLFHQPVITLPIIDSITKSPLINPPLVKQSSQPPPARQDSIQKKPRGVKGISDKDYHITLKKDSVP